MDEVKPKNEAAPEDKLAAGFRLGVYIGQLLAAGYAPEEIRAVVEQAIATGVEALKPKSAAS